ncbi:MAG: Dabb family protein [Cyclobacteriaceae bacterium]|jgi:hypothetical protein|nr:Dabb family protein [Cyclobacteriaceae bacterium]
MNTITRRTFIGTTSLFAAGTLTSCMEEKKTKPPLTHHVFFWLKNPDSDADRNKLIEGLRTLANIETIRELHIGIPASTEKRDVVDNSYSVSELMFFDDVEGQNIYQEHPVHKQFVENYSYLWERAVVYDSIAV